jgi:hypothetical protein
VPGRRICYALELPQRANSCDISAVPDGSYSGFPKLSSNNGRIIVLQGMPNRDLVQLHAGNTVDDAVGFIILGSSHVQEH